MVKHYVMWNFAETLSQEEKQEAGQKIKIMLEGLKDLEGAVEVKVVVNELEASTRDIALISSFETQEALDAYQVHPRHEEAKAFIVQVTCDRVCFDFAD